jgi:sRNA-binding carbon storage regulator CsrA
MLVLERKTGESILIYPNDDIRPEMTVAELFSNGPIKVAVKCRDHSAIKLAIDAPYNMKILRYELLDRIK